MCVHTVVRMCKDATPYPRCPAHSKTNRQRAQDAWLYEGEREMGKRMIKSEQDGVGANSTGLLYDSVSERSTSSEHCLNDNGTRCDPSIFLEVVSTTKRMRGGPSASLHSPVYFIFMDVAH